MRQTFDWKIEVWEEFIEALSNAYLEEIRVTWLFGPLSLPVFSLTNLSDRGWSSTSPLFPSGNCCGQWMFHPRLKPSFGCSYEIDIRSETNLLHWTSLAHHWTYTFSVGNLKRTFVIFVSFARELVRSETRSLLFRMASLCALGLPMCSSTTGTRSISLPEVWWRRA